MLRSLFCKKILSPLSVLTKFVPRTLLFSMSTRAKRKASTAPDTRGAKKQKSDDDAPQHKPKPTKSKKKDRDADEGDVHPIAPAPSAKSKTKKTAAASSKESKQKSKPSSQKESKTKGKTKEPIKVSLDQAIWYRVRRSGLAEPFSSLEECARQHGGIQSQMVSASHIALLNRVALPADNAGGKHEEKKKKSSRKGSASSDGVQRPTTSMIDAALYESKTLVRNWAQRHTIHLFPSEDWPMVHAAISRPEHSHREGLIFRKLGQKELDKYRKGVDACEKLLKKHKVLSRADLASMEDSPFYEDEETKAKQKKKKRPETYAEYMSAFNFLEAATGSWGVFADLSRRGVVCHARPNKFAWREHWLPESKTSWGKTSQADAAAAIARVFFHTYGPASEQDFRYWFGCKAGESRDACAALDLVEVVVSDGGAEDANEDEDAEMEAENEGEEAEAEAASDDDDFVPEDKPKKKTKAKAKAKGKGKGKHSPQLMLREDLEDLQADVPEDKEWPVKLLGRFDPFLLAHKDKTHMVGRHYRTVWRGGGLIDATLMVRGRVCGTWKTTKSKEGLSITINVFGGEKTLSDHTKAQVKLRAKEMAAFHELDLASLNYA